MKKSIQELQKNMLLAVKAEDLKVVADAQKLMKITIANIEQEIELLTEDGQKMKSTLSKLTEAPSVEDFILIRNRVDSCENDSSKIRKLVSDLEKKIKMLKSGLKN